MGQKINPIGFRLGVQRNWSSRWYAVGRDFSSMLLQDIEVRKVFEKTIGSCVRC
jgi:small subunit ribosomal protein S3